MRPFNPRCSRAARRRHTLILTLLVAMSLSACGGADDDGEQGADAANATPIPDSIEWLPEGASVTIERAG